MLLSLIALVLASSLVAEARKVHFSLQLKGRGKIDAATGDFHLHAKGNSQTDTTKITAHAIDFEVKELVGTYAELHVRSGSTPDSVFGNFSIGTHLSRDHDFQFAGGYNGDQGTKKEFFAFIGAPYNGRNHFKGIDGRISASGQFDVENTTSGNDDLHGQIHFTIFAHAD